MKKLDNLKFSEKELNAIYKLKRKLLNRFPRTRIILYGSKVKSNSFAKALMQNQSILKSTKASKFLLRL